MLKVVIAIAALLAVVASAEPFVYGKHKRPAEERVVGEATVRHPIADAAWKASVNGKKPAFLKPPRTRPQRPHDARHPAPTWSIANLKDPKPMITRPRAQDTSVRAHIVTPEAPTPPPLEVKQFVRAHIIHAEPRVRPVRPPREYVSANAHITRADDGHRAHLKVTRQPREYVVANAHITRPEPRAPKARREREFVVANAHITRPEPRKPRAPKPAREFVSADINHFPKGRDGSPQQRAPRTPKPEPELVSADIRPPK
jgi:hypothetical protein